MEQKKLSDKAKEELRPFLDSYTENLLNGLVQDGILRDKIVSGSAENTYVLVNEVRKKINSINEAGKEESDIIKSYFEFREIIINVYYHLKYPDSNEARKLPLSMLIDKFESLEVFKIPVNSRLRLKDIIDKGDRLLNDPEIREDAVKLFKEYKFSFGSYIIKLLEYFLFEKASKFFISLDFGKPTEEIKQKRSVIVDVIGKNKSNFEPDIIFDLKYRKKTLHSIKENLFHGYEHLSKYNNRSQKSNYLILVTFTDEDSNNFETQHYRFKQNLEELFPNYADKIFFVPISTKYLNLLEYKFKELESLLLRQTNFLFVNQIPPEKRKDLDDHYYPKKLDLVNYNYEIIIKPTSFINHWRFGVKFSKDGNFSSHQNRLGQNCPLFHIEKNADYSGIKATYYDGSGKMIYNKFTTIENYKEETIIFKMEYEKSGAIIKILDLNRKSILDFPLSLSGFRMAELFAWGDSKNPFEIKALIVENAHGIDL